MFLDAVLAADALAIKWPGGNIVELDTLAYGFRLKSSHGIIDKCIGALDGMLVYTEQPKNVDNPRAYFSGHYEHMGVNVQAVCDSNLRFIYIATAAPGGTPDITAYRDCDIGLLIDALPAGYFIVADAAYVQSEQVLIPYTGSQRNNEGNDIFNFYLSQVRIRIEMAFGLLQTKWRIFRTPLQVSIARVSDVIEVGARLHNFIISYKLCHTEHDGVEDDSETIVPLGNPLVPRGYGYTPSTPEDPARLQRLQSVQGTSMLRQTIRNYIDALGYERPGHNVDRNEDRHDGDLYL
jgi:hypothetical protein